MSIQEFTRKPARIDDIDRRIIGIIQDDSRLTYGEIGARVGLSVSAVNDRLKKMHTQNIIKSYTAIINPRAIGIDVSAFIQVSIEKPSFFSDFISGVQKMPEVQECHHVTGAYTCLLKVRATTTAHLEKILNEGIKTLPGVVRTETQIVLSALKETTKIEEPVFKSNEQTFYSVA